MKDIEELKKFIESLKEENIIFKQYFYNKIRDRPYLNDKEIKKTIKDNKNLLGFQHQVIKNEERYRIGFRLSGKYNLVIVIKIKGINLYIITAWKTNRKWQKAIQK